MKKTILQPQTSKLVECSACERLITVTREFKSQGHSTVIIMDDQTARIAVQYVPKDDDFICQVCAAEITIELLREYVEAQG